MDLLQPVQQQINSFSTLIDLLTKRNHHDLIASIKMLNPEDGVTPDRLSRDYSLVFYLYIVSKCTEPKDWKYEFLLLEMEERLTEVPDKRMRLEVGGWSGWKWRRNCFITETLFGRNKY
jgi:hypothetical protein